MMRTRTRLLTFARIMRAAGQASIFEREFARDLLESMNPTVRVTRYGRTWRLSRIWELEPGVVAAKLGFERVGTEEAVSYNEQQRDFVSVARPSEQGSFSHFVVDLDDRLLVFEERPPNIKRGSFLGAFRALLNESPHKWVVETLAEPAEFRVWVESVTRLTHFRARLMRPNPEWRERTGKIRELIEPTRADEVVLDAKVGDPSVSSLQVEDTILEQAVEHASAGYARIKASGVRDDGQSTFDSERTVRTAEVVLAPEDDRRASSERSCAPSGERHEF